jgi:hypothetical protein
MEQYIEQTIRNSFFKNINVGILDHIGEVNLFQRIIAVTYIDGINQYIWRLKRIVMGVNNGKLK